MVVLAGAICTREGKALLSRQFVPITRVRIEGLLAAFPKLMGSDPRQHTYIETDSVRYLYQPLDSLYMLIITNKSSNILEDLDTLQILAKLIPEYCRILDEDEVLKNAFTLVFAFDEVIAGGYREKVTVQQIKTFMEMDSQQEKLAHMLETTKLMKARQEADARAQEISAERLHRTAMSSAVGYGGGGPTQSPSFGYGFGSGSGSGAMSGVARTPTITPSVTDSHPSFRPVQSYQATSAKPARRGMVLGGQTDGRESEFLQAMAKDGDNIQLESTSSTHGSAQPVVTAVPTSDVTILIEETLSVSLDQDGSLLDMVVKGSLTVTINNPECGRALVRLSNDATEGFRFIANPNVDRMAFRKDSLIKLKDTSRAFPTGGPLGVLKWKMESKEDSSVPIIVTCWPSAVSSAGQNLLVTTLEYELLHDHLTLNDLCIQVPIPSGTAPVVDRLDGDYQYEPAASILNWIIATVDSSSTSGSIEFRIPFDGPPTALFPIHVSFHSNSTICPVSVASVEHVDNPENSIDFEEIRSLGVEEYTIS
eukprot:CAMPEP_0174230194 /NCGR_PEP_ID=MMETSP0417-20130205/1001_1 /TAXON_ID=242541 /ORGANISM="Mayorella sp, Strain BSH-02190019" /LENGTH=536 /DNA_ID=CAMNT_0015307835 /DNA_START=24 /DNA_END=1634 /DNA_ORIENTATION=-